MLTLKPLLVAACSSRVCVYVKWLFNPLPTAGGVVRPRVGSEEAPRR